MTQIILKYRQNSAQYQISLLRNFGVFSFLRSCKLTRFLTTCLSATSFKIWTFSRFLCISETAQTNFFLKISSNNLRNVYNIYTFDQFWEEKKLVFLLFVSKPCFSDFQFAPWLAGYPSVKLLQCYIQVYLPKISFLIEGLVWFHLYCQRFPEWVRISDFFLVWLNVHLRVSAFSFAISPCTCNVNCIHFSGL